jgi:hypothetical protein
MTIGVSVFIVTLIIGIKVFIWGFEKGVEAADLLIRKLHNIIECKSKVVPDGDKLELYGRFHIWDRRCARGCGFNLRSNERMWMINDLEYPTENLWCPSCGYRETVTIGECKTCKNTPIWDETGQARKQCNHGIKSKGAIATFHSEENLLEHYKNPKLPVFFLG